MTEQPRTPTHRLSALQATLVDYARSDLEFARATDLAQLDQARLILLAERLRARLDDALQVIGEIARD
ncbi:hypothetical protein ACFZB5_13300 [Streptomyces nodosus]|uniref:hypothetical protein n=1 Tax=Streptomyces nodosus TaxID=40318 RepID=UPI0036EB6AD0